MEAASERRGERGVALLEILVAVCIIGLVVIVGLSSMSAMIRTSEQQRQRAVAAAELRRFAEWVRVQTYTPCADLDLDALAADFTRADSQTQVRITDADFWVPPPLNSTTPAYSQAFVESCPASDPGAQRLTLEVAYGTGAPVIVTTQVVVTESVRPAT